jgi:hypothetical protein
MKRSRGTRGDGRAGTALLRAALLAGLCLSAAACGGGGGSVSNSPSAAPVYADRVVRDGHLNPLGATQTDWPFFFQPQVMLGPPGGIMDVFSLGYDPSAKNPPRLGGSVVLGFGDATGRRCVVDGPGPDLTVYENPFRTVDSAGNAGTNNEVATVEISADLTTWYLFPPGDDTSLPAILTRRYSKLAGVTPTDEGGDSFDLAQTLPAVPAGFQACYVRITDGGTVWPDYGNTQTDVWASGTDIDSVQALHHVAAPIGLAK